MKSRQRKIISVLLLVIICLSALCGCVGDTGEVIEEAPFYSLQAAYNNGYISRRNLRKIDSNLQKKKEVALDEEQIQEIKAEFVKNYPRDEKNEDNVIIRQCLGIYGDCIALMISYDDAVFFYAFGEEKVGGVTVHYVDSQRAMIYKKN